MGSRRPEGIYFSPTISGTGLGPLIATAWAAMLSIGEDDNTDLTKRIVWTADGIRRGLASEFLQDLRDATREAVENPTRESGLAPVDGMAESLPEKSVSELLKSMIQ